MQKWKSKEFFMNNRRYRHRLLALSASILLGLSGLSSSAVDAAEVTVEQPAADTTVSQDTGNPSADTKEAAEGQTEGETTEPERIEPIPRGTPTSSSSAISSPTTPPTGHRGLPYGQNQPLSWIWTAGLSSIPKTWMSQSIRPVSLRFSPH